MLKDSISSKECMCVQRSYLQFYFDLALFTFQCKFILKLFFNNFFCSDTAARALWEALLNTKHKEAVMEVRRHLVEAASRESLPIKMSMGKHTAGPKTILEELNFSLFYTGNVVGQHVP